MIMPKKRALKIGSFCFWDEYFVQIAADSAKYLVGVNDCPGRACPYDVALSFIMLPKWRGRDNPLWLSCIRTGTGAAIIWTGTGACPYINPFQTVL